MFIWSRVRNTFRGGAVSRELEEELAVHVADAIAEGRDPVAQAGEIARRVTVDVFSMVTVGAAAGVALGIAAARYVEGLLYGVRPTGLGMLAAPAVAIAAAALLAAIPAVLLAVRTDPVSMLRSE